MARERKSNYAKCTVWTEIMRADVSGNIGGVCRHLFMVVPEAQKESLLAQLKADLEKSKAKKGGAA